MASATKLSVAGGTPLCILYFMEGQGARLKAARIAAGFGDATAAARRFGWTVPTYLAHENGSRGFGVERAQAYAAAFKANASWVLTGEGHPAPTVKLRIGGYVGVGGQVYLFTDESPNFAGNEEVEIPAGFYGGYLAFKVRGDANYPAYRDNEILFVRKDSIGISATLNRDCIVRIRDGRTLLRTVMQGASPNLFTLLWTNAPPMPDQEIEWAAPIEWTHRR